MSEIGSDTFEALCAYHDGELRGLARWRFERRLRREPGLRRELAALARVGELVRESEAAAQPDLWDRIELRLPSIDAQRAEAATAPASWWRPLGALAAAAAVLVVAVYVGLFEPSPAPGGAVRWMDSGGRSVLVLDDAESDVTIIWLLNDAAVGAARGGSGDVA
jgi:anti-sigma-K factor RskA